MLSGQHGSLFQAGAVHIVASCHGHCGCQCGLGLFSDAYGAPLYVMDDNGKKLVAKSFDAVCAVLGLEHYFNTAYRSETNGQTRRFKKKIVQRLRH